VDAVCVGFRICQRHNVKKEGMCFLSSILFYFICLFFIIYCLFLCLKGELNMGIPLGVGNNHYN